MNRKRLFILLSPLLLAGIWAVYSFSIELIKRKNQGLPQYGSVGEFLFKDQNGDAFGKDQLAGRVWISNFIFTRCQGPCPLLSQKMARLQKNLPQGIKLVSFSVDPEYDTPGRLAVYSKKWDADQERWSFVTGKKELLHTFIRGVLHLPVEPSQSMSSHSIIHSQRFMLVGPQGEIRGYYDGTDQEDLQKLETEALFLFRGEIPPWVRRLPSINASLNATSAFLILLGMGLILRKRVTAHKILMSLAVGTSFFFLVSYLTYHFFVGATRFTGEGWIRYVYFFILISHTILATIIIPLVGITVWWAWREKYDKHISIARWTFPIWFYVSVTGVIVYWMLYHLYPQSL